MISKESYRKQYEEYQRREQERLRQITEIQGAKYDRLDRLLQSKEGKESEFAILSRRIDQEAPGLQDDEKFLLVYSAMTQLEQIAGRNNISPGFYRNLSIERIQQTVIKQIDMLRKYTNPNLTETIRKFLTHGVIRKSSQQKKIDQ